MVASIVKMATIVYEREMGFGTILNIHGKELASVVQKLDSAIQRISVSETNRVIQWIVIYFPVDSVNQLLNNLVQGSILLRHWIKKYSYLAFARLRIHSVFYKFTLWKGDSRSFEFVWRIHQLRVDGSGIHREKVAESKCPDTCGWSYGSEDVSERWRNFFFFSF